MAVVGAVASARLIAVRRSGATVEQLPVRAAIAEAA
jgi:hypothetical protein